MGKIHTQTSKETNNKTQQHTQNNEEMADKVREQQVYEQLKSRHIGLGDQDTTKHEWMTNVHRDSYASVIGHPSMLSYLSVAHGIPKALLKTELIEKMVRPCGPKPE